MNYSPHSLKSWLVVIPARLASTRLPHKALADLNGKPLIVRVRENLKPLSDAGAKIIIATDSHEIESICKDHGFLVEMTAESHKCGSDRVWEVAQRNATAPFILNVQGDEPFAQCRDLFQLCQNLESRTDASLATLVYRSKDQHAYQNPNVVKAIAGGGGAALYFSRAPLPYFRDIWNDQSSFLQHIGIYAFRREGLKTFCSLSPSNLEQTERLEQLRALEAGMKVLLVEATATSLGIDTPEDLEKARALQRK